MSVHVHFLCILPSFSGDTSYTSANWFIWFQSTSQPAA